MIVPKLELGNEEEDNMKYLLDTNVLVAMFRNQHGIRERILRAGVDNCFVSEATLAELKVGAYKTNDPRQWREVKETNEAFAIVPITAADFDLYARNRALLESQGIKIDSFDLLIGSSAVNNGLTIVTHNKKHFVRIPHLQIVDWEE